MLNPLPTGRVGFGKAGQVAHANTLIYHEGQRLKVIPLYSVSIECICF